MHPLELKVHPPIVLAACAALAWLVARFIATPLDVRGELATGGAVVLCLLGVALAVSALLAFWRAKTTIDPTKPDSSTSLVTFGVFRFTRNPMYLALALFLAGWVVYLGSVIAMLLPVVFVAYITRFQILPEERILASKFGDAFERYCNEVRRWL